MRNLPIATTMMFNNHFSIPPMMSIYVLLQTKEKASMLDCDCINVKCLGKTLNKQVAHIKNKMDTFIKTKRKEERVIKRTNATPKCKQPEKSSPTKRRSQDMDERKSYSFFQICQKECHLAKIFWYMPDVHCKYSNYIRHVERIYRVKRYQNQVANETLYVVDDFKENHNNNI